MVKVCTQSLIALAKIRELVPDATTNIHANMWDRFWENFKMLCCKDILICIGNALGMPDNMSPLELSLKNLKLVCLGMPNYTVTPKKTDFYMKELWSTVKGGTH